MTRAVYLVKTRYGYLGYRRGGWGGRDHPIDQADFEHARIYTRRSDAEGARNYFNAKEVVEATLTLRVGQQVRGALV